MIIYFELLYILLLREQFYVGDTVFLLSSSFLFAGERGIQNIQFVEESDANYDGSYPANDGIHSKDDGWVR